MPELKKTMASQWIVAGLFVGLTLAALYGFVRVGEPDERAPQGRFRDDYSEKPLADALAGHGFETRLAEIAAAGSAPGEAAVGRMSGSPGFYRTEQLILEAYRAAGLEIQTQALPVVVPVTEFCEILDGDGRRIDDVQVFPFEPAGFLPTALPAGGITGALVEVENLQPEHLAGHAPERSIVVTTLDAASDWSTLPAIGVPALLVKEEREDIRRALRTSPDQQDNWAGLTTAHSVTFPRFLVRGPIERYAGRPVTLRCRVAWQTREVRNLIGVLRSERPRDEALVVTSFYDSSSVVPDLAPGAEQSISLAAMLDYVRALAPYRDDLQRDVVFVAVAGHFQAMAGERQLLEAIATFSAGGDQGRPFEARKDEEQRQYDLAVRGLDVLGRLASGGGGGEAGGTSLQQRWADEPEDIRAWLAERQKTVAGEVCLDRKEDALQARLAHLRTGGPAFRDGFDDVGATDEQRKDPANTHPLLARYLAAKTLENRAAHFMSLPLCELAGREEYAAWGYAERLRAYLERIAEHHRRQLRELDDRIAVRDLFGRYKRTLTVALDMYSGGYRRQSDLAVLVGIAGIGTVVEPQVSELANAIQEEVPAPEGVPAFNVVNWGSLDAAARRDFPNANGNLTSALWHRCGRMAFTVANREYAPSAGTRIVSPEDTLENLNQTDVLRQHVPALGKALLAVAYGRVTFKTLSPAAWRGSVFALRGTVYANAGSSDIVAGHRMAGRTFARVANTSSLLGARGIRPMPLLEANPYGEFEAPLLTELPWTFSMEAARFADDGCVAFIKDDSDASQAIFKNQGLSASSVSATGSQPPKPVNIALFRCAPVSIFDQGNPTTMKAFKRLEFLVCQGMSAPTRLHRETITTFLPPDTVFYAALLDGAAGNEEVQTYRAFMLGVDPDEPIGANEPELHGRGYLAADTPTLTWAHVDAAASMLRTAEKRLGVQRRFGMADTQMLDFHARGRDWLDEARAKRAADDPGEALSAAATSLAYAINNHPVIRRRIAHAVVGILWYLGLLVPFVFFAEKLLFGFPDIRKQLAAVGAIFLVVFTLLRLFHPAFQMVRSSLMILLGFVMLLLTALVTGMVSGKFRQNIKDLRGHEGKVEGADVNRGGVVGTAFMLGLNNMRRRKVRTGLTCTTLVLITFVMICFTSVSTDLVDVEYVTGRSSWNGLTIRDPDFLGLDGSELATIRRLYGDRFPTTVHTWMVRQMGVWGGNTENIRNLDVAVDREFEVAGTRTVKRAQVSSLVAMEWNEPMFSGLDRHLLTSRGWFDRPPSSRAEKVEAARAGAKRRKEAVLPEAVARKLGITVADVNEGEPVVNIQGEEFRVRGIIDSVGLSKTLGLDGASILPYDINSVQALGTRRMSSGQTVAVVPANVARLPASDVILVSAMPPVKAEQTTVAMSCSVLFPREPYRLTPEAPERPAVGYREQRRVVMEYLERTARPAYYALDGISYAGSRKRTRTMGGMLELLVPIVIAALAVFNTMRGSVYERRGEIYVYNAVGIAPNHVFFMFMAEALVYAVVGAMLGYLLSQATGRALTLAGLTGGLNMDYSSIETIYASLAIMGAVLLSALLPARDAARMAAPSELVSWTVPRAEGDGMSLHLPFTFTTHDRIAVLCYFWRWLDANGTGSSGPFFCAPPQVSVRAEPSQPEGDRLVPVVSSLVWLKPYDLGVSHRMEIALPTDPETGEYIARVRLVRQSGHTEAWRRTVKPFLGVLRKQFLSWRATTDAARAEMFAEAKAMLERQWMAESDGSGADTHGK